MRPLPVGRDAGCLIAELADGLRLIVGAATATLDELLRIARVDAEAGGMVTSRSTAAGWRAILIAGSGRVGVDVETLGRVALNTTAQDRWLTVEEQACVLDAVEPVLERACRWVLKEAYGKALGVGLALPLDQLTFGARHGAVTLQGRAAPPSPSSWTFGLYRVDDAVFATAHCRLAAGQATLLAPAGMKPPMAELER